MPIVADMKADFNGKINVNDPIEVKTINKLPVGVIEVKLNISVEWGYRQDQANQPFYQVGYRIEETRCTLKFGQIPISVSFESPGSIDPNMMTSLSHILRISTEDLREIESRRVDDLILYLHLEGTIIPHRLNSSQNLGEPKKFSLPIPWKFSQKEWIQFLSNIGYSERWIVEMERPKLEGFIEVMEHLTKAQEALFNKGDPEDVLRDLRAARDSFRPFYDSRKNQIAEIIDKGSIGEKNQDPKSTRIADMYDKIANFLNIGPHNDKYKVTYADAQLAFREFVSMLSYLSPIIAQLKNDEEEKDKKVE